MMTDLLKKFNIDSYGFIPAALCREQNTRLYRSVPKGCNVVFMLFPYYTKASPKTLSKYAAVYDYHSFAKEVLTDLCDYIKSKYPDSFACGFCDHSPYSEAVGAAMAGLGVIGRHSLLINEKYSSFVFIGELVTDLDRSTLLSEGIPEGDGRIGECRRCGLCTVSCPGGCAGTSDRQSCASAVTQKKGELSRKEAELIKKSNTLWGCDICQLVCPHTKEAEKKGTLVTPIPFFSDSCIKSDPSEAIPSMDDGEFARYPFSWRKRCVIERNIEILNSGELSND